MLHTLSNSPKPNQAAMSKRTPYEDFSCPKCGAQYKLVRMPAQANFLDRPVQCKNCSQELPSTDDGNILKYFLVGRRRRSQSAAPRVDSFA